MSELIAFMAGVTLPILVWLLMGLADAVEDEQVHRAVEERIKREFR